MHRIVLLLLLFTQITCASSVRFRGDASHRFTINGIRIYPDTKLKDNEVEILKTRLLLFHKLANAYFPYYNKIFNKKKLKVYVYTNKNKSLISNTSNKYSKAHLIQAYYVRSQTSLHIPLNVREATWRHEFVHVLLEGVHPGAPNWLHEGMAGFFGEHTPSLDCGLQEALLIPERIRTREHKYKFDYLKRAFKNSVDRLDYHYMEFVLSFNYYLWQRKILGYFLIEYQKNRKVKALELLSRLLDMKPQQIQHDFFHWLDKVMKKSAKIRGC